MAKTKIEYTSKTVIENKLLAALEQEGTVAVLLGQDDLDLLISALRIARTDRMGSMMHHGRMMDDFIKLREGAFGKE